jgi:hypothetical protein
MVCSSKSFKFKRLRHQLHYWTSRRGTKIRLISEKSANQESDDVEIVRATFNRTRKLRDFDGENATDDVLLDGECEGEIPVYIERIGRDRIPGVSWFQRVG